MKRKFEDSENDDPRKTQRASPRESPERDVKDAESLRDEASDYFLGTAMFPLNALDPTWSFGQNRTINESHKKKLYEMFKTDGVKRADISCRIRIACTQLEFETMKEHALETMTDSQLPELWFGDWEQIIGRKAELLAGNHRVEALKELLRWSASDEREWWWMADIYNQDNLPASLHMKLRANRQDFILVDGHSQIWGELAALEEQGEIGDENGKIDETQVKNNLIMGGGTRYPVKRLCTLWRSKSWRPLITKFCGSAIGRSTFNITTFESMLSYRIDNFWHSILQAVIEVTSKVRRDCGIDIPAAHWRKLASIPTGEKRLEALQQLFYPTWDGHNTADRCRSSDFLSEENSTGYNKLYDLLSNDLELHFPDIHATLKSVRVEGKRLSQIISHVSYWLNGKAVPVHKQASNKPQRCKEFVPILQAKYADAADAQSDCLQERVLQYTMAHMNQLATQTNSEYLNQYPTKDGPAYAERFEQPFWWDLLIIVHEFAGPHFQLPVLRPFNVGRTPTREQSISPALPFADELCEALTRRFHDKSLKAEFRKFAIDFSLTYFGKAREGADGNVAEKSPAEVTSDDVIVKKPQFQPDSQGDFAAEVATPGGILLPIPITEVPEEMPDSERVSPKREDLVRVNPLHPHEASLESSSRLDRRFKESWRPGRQISKAEGRASSLSLTQVVNAIKPNKQPQPSKLSTKKKIHIKNTDPSWLNIPPSGLRIEPYLRKTLT